MDQNATINYHSPDNRWSSFYDIQSFDAYVNAFVVKGSFSSGVPKDVREAFTMAEYMMAHAYYHYPLFDEALSKCLRIIEMAIKLRCKDRGIPTDTYNNKQVRKARRLSDLMKAIVDAEPYKKLAFRFEAARRLRNSIMHPSQHSYAGPISRNYIKNVVTILNSLFIPDEYFKQCREQLKKISLQLEEFGLGLAVLQVQEGESPFFNLKIRSAIRIKSDWYYLFTAEPVFFDGHKRFKNHSYLYPLAVEVNAVTITNDSVHLRKDNGSTMLFKRTDDDFIESMFQAHMSSYKDAGPADQGVYDHHIRYEIAKADNDFWYNRLYMISP